ncbi:hypothetical protein HUU62_02020 [Rhodoferax sp. 4810]|uniref:Uncharacterized protein n=1 Tax=Thiospirillum jenense TaxID=1653858 RepID=A0A839H744_9GAMM|nr:hypothetical protein [Thiospirillum jenense]MBB1073189.1 hypothetical protein [Rhodoferax jenense]MBB1124650.1 hypothetical protein [Thiospirillum jenense]
MTLSAPIPLTDFSHRATAARALIHDMLTELFGIEPELTYEFYREWNGCWRARVVLSGAVTGRLEFTFMLTASGGLLAIPRPLPERWRNEIGIPASDGSRWTVNNDGQLVSFCD